MKFYKLITIFFIISCSYINTTSGKKILITEEEAINSDYFIINADGKASDYVNLSFGESLDANLKYDILNERFIISKDLYIKKEIIDSNGNTGLNGQVLTADGNGKNTWQTNIVNPIPYLDTSSKIYININKTKDFIITGKNFLPQSIVSIPNFGGTINSTNIISPNEIIINLTSDNIVSEYDIIVSNGDVANSLWQNNEKNQLSVTDSNGLTNSSPGLSCKKILDENSSSANGTYWIDPNGGSHDDSYQVYCDMTTDGGGWTRVNYSQDLPHQQQFSHTTDQWKWLDNDLSLSLSDQQINEIRSVSTEAKQTYESSCQGVITYYYNSSSGYGFAFGFRYHTGDELPGGIQTYSGTDINVSYDGCKINTNTLEKTIFEIKDLRLPIINVRSRDNSQGELFGSPLTQNPVWFR